MALPVLLTSFDAQKPQNKNICKKQIKMLAYIIIPGIILTMGATLQPSDNPPNWDKRIRMEYITRDEAVKLAGEDAVVKAEIDNAEFSHYEFDSVAVCVCQSQFYDADGFNVVVKVYYEHDKSDFDATEDLHDLNWVIAGYSV